MYRYSLPDTEGDDLGVILHPAPNLEPGDSVISENGKCWRVTRYVEASKDDVMHRLLEVSPTSE